MTEAVLAIRDLLARYEAQNQWVDHVSTFAFTVLPRDPDRTLTEQLNDAVVRDDMLETTATHDGATRVFHAALAPVEHWRQYTRQVCERWLFGWEDAPRARSSATRRVWASRERSEVLSAIDRQLCALIGETEVRCFAMTNRANFFYAIEYDDIVYATSEHVFVLHFDWSD